MSLIVEKKDRIGYITLNRPHVLNALDNETLQGLWDSWVAFGDDPEVYVIIITGAGERSFSVGRDLKKYRLEGEGQPKIEHVFEPFNQFSLAHAAKVYKPVIAAVNGYAMGWGFTIVLLADIVIASENASFAFPEVRHGLPTGIGSVLLARTIPWKFAMEILLTGERIDAERAERFGLVNSIVPQGELMAAAEGMATTICKNGPLAVMSTKRLAKTGLDMPFEVARDTVEMLRYIIRQSRDAQEGPKAFIEQREPDYQGE